MLVLVWLLTVMLMMKSGAASTKVIAQSGKAVLLTPDWQMELNQKLDFRWTHIHLVMSLQKNTSQCHHGRCEQLKNGSLSFSRVQAIDSGNYSLQVFDEDGRLLNKSDFLLIVKAGSSSSSSTVAAVVSVLLCCFILVIIFIFIKRRRSQNTSANTGPLQENIYVVMHSDRGDKMKGEEEEEEEKKQEKEKQEEEESHYVPCNAVVSLETPNTLSVDAEDIYI